MKKRWSDASRRGDTRFQATQGHLNATSKPPRSEGRMQKGGARPLRSESRKQKVESRNRGRRPRKAGQSRPKPHWGEGRRQNEECRSRELRRPKPRRGEGRM